jgi:membrane protease YdiL (CAAX protease family)
MRWWKPVATLVLFAVFAVVAINLGSLVLLLVGAAQGVSDLEAYLTQVTDVTKGGIGPVSFAFVNFTLIVLIPLAMLARRIVYGQRPRFLSSVAGGIRWRWLLRCLACTLPLWAVYIGVSTVATGTPDARPAYWGVLVVLVLLTTPLQCAGEEYTFRGLVMQTVGSWFRRPMVALVAGAIPAVGLFAAAHGSPDPFILIQLSIFALSCVVVTWRTGGLEAGIAMHLSNNVILMLVSIVYGGWGQAFVDSDTKGSLAGVLLEILVDGIAVTLILWQAKRAKIDRRFRPAPAVTDRVGAAVGPTPSPYGVAG